MFEWKPQYSVQMPEIDSQHQRLFRLAGELHAAMQQGKGRLILEQCLARLVDYTKTHFAAEEQMLRRYGYPDVAAHKVKHDKLTAHVVELQNRFRAGENTLSITLMQFLKDWLEQHIAGSDQHYSAYIRKSVAAPVC